MTDLLRATQRELKVFFECLARAGLGIDVIRFMNRMSLRHRHNLIAQNMRKALLEHPSSALLHDLFDPITPHYDPFDWSSPCHVVAFAPVLPRPCGAACSLSIDEIGEFLHVYGHFCGHLVDAGFTLEVIRAISQSAGNELAKIMADAPENREAYPAWVHVPHPERNDLIAPITLMRDLDLVQLRSDRRRMQLGSGALPL